MFKSSIKPIVVSVAECALMLGISRAKVYQLIQAGAFPLIRIAGKRTAIEVAAIEGYVRSCPVGVGEGPKKKKNSAAKIDPQATEPTSA